MTSDPVLFLTAGSVAILLCALYGWRASAAGWLAQPEARSSHRVPTVSGAGIAVVAAFSGVVLLLGPTLPVDARVLLGVSAMLSLFGLADDLVHLAVRLRLAVYAIAAASTAATLLHVPGLSAGGWLVLALAAAWILTFSNLFNFMDGIDGLAALQAFSAAVVLGLMATLSAAAGWYTALCWSLSGAFAGFLVFNWPPARLFMGDAGSIPAGYLLASLLVAGWSLGAVALSSGLILLALFILDAGTTLLFRALRGEPLTQAHRQHLYQRLAHRWSSHARVGRLFLAIQWLWLAPLAILSTYSAPVFSALLCVAAYLPLLIAMVKLRSMQ